MNETKRNILDYTSSHHWVSAPSLASDCGIKAVTARQYLSEMSRGNLLVRIGHGVYALPSKQQFSYRPSPDVKKIYDSLVAELPFTDFCVYDGSILTSIQHHLSINHAIYIETNRDAVESVFFRLKESHRDVFRQPNAMLMRDYVDLRCPCIIVKSLTTESPLTSVDGIKVPTLEKLLVDILRDDDFDYLRGAEEYNVYRQAFDLYTINIPKLLRYARRRGISQIVNHLINQTKNND